MNEQQYINATNRVKISMAITILRDVHAIGGADCGIDRAKFIAIEVELRRMEQKLFSIVEIKEE